MKHEPFCILGCQHMHIAQFIQEMIDLGYPCAGIYDGEDSAMASRLADRYGVPLFGDPEKLLSVSGSIVGSAAVNSDKIEIIELCERNGRHVMVDKPAVVDTAGLERLAEIIRRGRIQVAMMLTERFRPELFTLREAILQGVLGKIIQIQMRKPHRLRASSRPTWFFDKARNGGLVIDLLIHDFDLLRWLTGEEIAAVQGWTSKRILPEYPTFCDAASLQVLLGGGITAQLYADWHTPEASWTWGDGRIFVAGTNGCAELRLEGDPFLSKGPLFIQVTNDAPARAVEPAIAPLTLSKDFLNRIEGRSAVLTANDVLQACKAAVEADEAATIIQSL